MADISDYENLINMTDEQAADILENYRVRLNFGRKNGKSIMFLEYNIALTKAIQRLREDDISYTARKVHEGELTPNQARERLGLPKKPNDPEQDVINCIGGKGYFSRQGGKQ